jgi:hypothetical protein
MDLLKGLKRCVLRNFLLLFLVIQVASPSRINAQGGGELRGQVLDPSGAAVPGATVTLTLGSRVVRARSGQDGIFSFRSVSPGTYSVFVDAAGFAQFSKTDVSILAGRVQQLNVSLTIAVEQQNIQVTDQSSGVSLNPDENSGAIVIKGSDLDALSDDPDELQNELQALAGPAAGPNGGQIYIDGFTGGQIPPKSSIREIRVNQNQES